MDLSTLFAGAVQAAPPTAAAASAAAPVLAPVRGVGAAGDGGFASLVALALGEAYLAPVAASAAVDAPATTPSGRMRAEGAEDEPAEEAASPLDASADAATLSVLIALATPMVALPVSADTVCVAPPIAEMAPIEAVADGVAPAVLAATPVAPAQAGSVAAAPAAPAPAAPFMVGEPAPDGASPDAAVTDLSDLPPATDVVTTTPRRRTQPQPVPQFQAAPGRADAPHTPATVVDVSPVSSSAPSAAPAAAPAPATAPDAPQAAAAPVASTPTAAPPSAPPTRRVAPLRAALAAMAAAERTTDTQPAASAPPHVAQPVAAPATVAAPAQAAQTDAPTVAARREVAQPTAAAVSHVAAPAASRGDAGSASRDGADDARPNLAGQAFRPVATPRIDAAGVPTPVGDLVAAATSPPVAVPVLAPTPTPELAFRPIELPAMARLEQTLASIDPDTRNLQAMVRTVRLFSGVDGASEARLQLAPEHLGPVALTVRVEQGTVSAHFRAETPAAQRWIETHQQELRSGLREQGLEVREVVVTTDPDGRRERRQDAPQARPARARRNAGTEADLPRFEVLV